MGPIHEAVPLDGTAEDAPTARAAARAVLRRAGCNEDLASDALLCLSELVTNALLHAGGSLCVEITATTSALRIEVTDSLALRDSRNLPAGAAARQRVVDADRETGRGLAIVEQLSHAWGVDEAVSDGRPAKVVWAELVAPEPLSPPTPRPAAPRPREGPDTSGGPLPSTEAALIDVPIRLFLASEAHLEALLRDMQLFAADWRARDDHLVKSLAEALRRNRAARAASMAKVHRHLAAGVDVITMRFPITAETPARAVDFLEVVSASEARTGRGLDDADPAAAELRHFRRWYVAELTHQALGGSPRRCPFRP